MNERTHKKREKTPRLFTLVELLVVIGIIALLAAMLMPALSSARDQAREGSTKSEIKSLEMAMTSYHQDLGVYPPDDYGTYGSGERQRGAGQALVRYLDPSLDDPNTDESTYFDFDPKRIRKGSNDEVFINQFRADAYYRFRNNADGGEVKSWSLGDWDVSYVNRSSVDIWSADATGKDFVDRNEDDDWEDEPDRRYPTRQNLVDHPDREYHTIGNW